MRLASLVISLCLHAALFLLIWFWPQPAPLRLDKPPMMISLVEGAAGGNRAPSPILGHMGETGEGPLAPTPPAPMAEVAASAREEIRAPELKAPPASETPVPAKPEPVKVAESKPEPVIPPEPQKPPEPKKPEVPRPEPPKPEPKKSEAAKPEPKKPEPKKPEPKKQEPKKAEPKKPAPKKPAKPDPVAAALQQARKATSRANSGDRGNAVEQALAQARKGASGNRGGGGGEGDGPGGGGLGDVYIGQVMLAVRPNWGFASPGRRGLACVVRVNVDLQGVVQRTEVAQSSGSAQFDASAVNAIVRTSNAGQFPPPPGPEYTDLDLVFTLDEMTGR